MLIQVRQNETRAKRARLAFTLIEVLISLVIFTMVLAGVIYGYSQANRVAEWTSMSLAAQSFALQGMEQARAAKWNPWDWNTNTGPGTQDELPPNATHPVYTQVDLLDIPIKGNPFATNSSGAFTNYSFFATNYIYVTQVQTNPPLRQIRSVCLWTFPLTPWKTFSNTVITLRASDQ